MYNRNRKKRTFFSPGSEDRAHSISIKRKREDLPDEFDFKPDSEKVAKDQKDKSAKAGQSASLPASPPTSSNVDLRTSTSSTSSTGEKTEKAKKTRKEGEKDKRERVSDEEENTRAPKRRSTRKSHKHDLDGSEYYDGEGGSDEWGSEEGNYSDNESGDESPSGDFQFRDREPPDDNTSNFDGDEQDVEFDESETPKPARSKSSGDGNTNGVSHEGNGSSGNPSESTKVTSEAGEVNATNQASSSEPPSPSISTSSREKSSGLFHEKTKKKDPPASTKSFIKKSTPKAPITHTPLNFDSLTPEIFKAVIEEMRTEMVRMNDRLEETTATYNARLQEYEEKYIPRAVYNVIEEEVAYLKQQLQGHPSSSSSSSQLDVHSNHSMEKVKHEITFLRGSIEDVSSDVRQWRMAMDVDLTDKEDRLTQLSLRLDDIERNQQALIIRYPQLMQPAPSGASTAPPSTSDRIPSSGEKTPSGVSGSSKTSINSMQKDRDKHSQSAHSQRLMLPPDMPSKYPPTNAPSSPQQSPASSSSFLSFESNAPPPFPIQPDSGWGGQSSMYGRPSFATPAAPNAYYQSGANYKSSSSKTHAMPIERQSGAPHERTHDRQHERQQHHDRDRLHQERIFQQERIDRDRLQQQQEREKASRVPPPRNYSSHSIL